MWVIYVIVALLIGATGFLVGVAYGMEHKE